MEMNIQVNASKYPEINKKVQIFINKTCTAQLARFGQWTTRGGSCLTTKYSDDVFDFNTENDVFEFNTKNEEAISRC